MAIDRAIERTERRRTEPQEVANERQQKIFDSQSSGVDWQSSELLWQTSGVDWQSSELLWQSN